MTSRLCHELCLHCALSFLCVCIISINHHLDSTPAPVCKTNPVEHCGFFSLIYRLFCSYSGSLTLGHSVLFRLNVSLVFRVSCYSNLLQACILISVRSVECFLIIVIVALKIIRNAKKLFSITFVMVGTLKG